MRKATRILLAILFTYAAAYTVTKHYAGFGIEPDVARAFGSIGAAFAIWYLIDRNLRA